MISVALDQLDLTWQWFDKRNKVDFDFDSIYGIIVNIKITSLLVFTSRHWISVRKIQDKIYMFDSTLKEPIIFRNEETCNEELQRLIKEKEAEVLCIKVKEEELIEEKGDIEGEEKGE